MYREWEEKTRQLLEKYPEQRERFETLSGIEVKRLYTTRDRKGEEMEKIGLPGEYPYTRGIRPTMYRSRNWTMRQYAGFGSAARRL
ncbi:methylmalonyl-CoA mutase large subunit, MutB [Mycobacterium tuberculosis]|nr:methylmalonyl-CoA mutase large subunit, MutB [Mycobacterium tuberculosis]